MITVNGHSRDYPGAIALGDLLAQLGLRTDGVAVAVNLEVVPRAEIAARPLNDGDKIEIVHMVGGG